jgi:multidrug efflux system outer membrane protein
MRKPIFVAALLPSVLLAACAVGPNYRRPYTPVTETYRGQEMPEPTSIADLPWWELFHDDVLQFLIAESLKNNYDLQTAIARVESARGVLISTRSQMFPQAEYQGSAMRGRQFQGPGVSVGGQTFGGNRTFDVFAGTLNAAWEIDLWGRIRRATESSRADLLASNDFRRGVILSLVSQVAQTYFQLLELDAELEIAQRSTKTFGETLELFQRQFEGGIGTKLAVARGEAALAQAAAGIPDTERFIVETENAICILLGWPPTAIPRGALLTSQELPPQPPAGIPADLLERRPDVLQAEQVLRSNNAQIGVSIADFFPRIGLTALYGGTSSELESVVKGAGNVWSIAASVTGPIFQAGKLYGGYKSAVANWEAAKWQYEGVVLTALREVSNALVDAQKLKDVRDQRAKAVTALQEASELATIRYTGGLATYFEVLEAQQQLFPAEDQLAQTERDELLAVVQLYAALGGGWSDGEQHVPLDAFPYWP